MSKENNYFEGWNDTIKKVYGGTETDSLQVANEESNITKQGCCKCESIEPVTTGSVAYYSNLCDSCFEELRDKDKLVFYVPNDAYKKAEEYRINNGLDSLQVANEGSSIVNKKDKELPTIEDYNKLALMSQEQIQRADIQLVKLNAEKTLIENELKDKLDRAKRKIESLYTRVENGDEIYESDGLQSLGVDIDSLKSRLVSYNQFIEYMEEIKQGFIKQEG
ncbi:hypothetical protein ACQUY5_30690 [Bacillus cereus]|uniref:hypothetical protein n=1 Tax=Bacillus cereus TaxID=1396 RepID=UPI003D180088